jgi:hypothetical protein
MAKLRRVHVAIGLAVVLAATGACGTEGAVAASGLDVFLESAEIRGGDGVTASRLPAGTLRESEPLHTHVLLEAEVEASYAGLLHYEGRAQRAGGDAGLGVTGVCGQGWTPDGEKKTGDPCAAADYLSYVPAGRSIPVGLLLYPMTEAGHVTPGSYRLSIPLDEPEGPLLDLRYRIVRSGDADLPPWPEEAIPFGITLETYPDRWWELRIRFEDGYGRVIDERDLADHRDDQPFVESDALLTVDVPLGLPIDIVLLEREGGDWIPCGVGGAFVTEKQKPRGPTAIIPSSCLQPRPGS